MSLVSKKIYTTCITVVLLTALWWFSAGPLGTGSFFGRYSKRVFVANAAFTYMLSCSAYLLWPGVWHRKRIYRIIGSIMGFAVALATLELTAFVGLVDYRKIIRQPFYKPWDNPDILLDEDVIFRHYPNDHFSGLTQGDLVSWLGFPITHQFDADVQYDRFGFRNSKELEHAELIVVGDSFVESPNVPFEQIGSSRIGKILNTTVLNLGLSGYGPQHELAALRKFGFDRKPQVVVWVWFEGNDAPPDFNKYERFTNDWPAFVKKHHGYLAKSFSVNLIKWLAHSTIPKNMYAVKANRQSGLLESTKPNKLKRMYFGYNPAPFSIDDSRIVERALDVVGTAVTDCRDKGIDFLLVYAPTKFRVYGSICNWGDDSICKKWTCNNMPERIKSWAIKQHISFLDLTPHLKDSAQDGNQVYELEDTHWTPAGHGLAAKHIADFIQKADWLSDRS